MLTLLRRRRDKAATEEDAARLMRDFGTQAFAAAGEMSWREDAGLLASRCPGHWYRVQQEIGRRLASESSSEQTMLGFEPGWSTGDTVRHHVG